MVLLVGEDSGFVNAVLFLDPLDGVSVPSSSPNMFGAELGFARVPVSLSFKRKKESP